MASGQDSITLLRQVAKRRRKSMRRRWWPKSKRHVLSERQRHWPAPLGPVILGLRGSYFDPTNPFAGATNASVNQRAVSAGLTDPSIWIVTSWAISTQPEGRALSLASTK